MAAFRLFLLGTPLLTGPEGPIRPGPLKGQALLWYLASQPRRTFTRAQLAALLWEEASEASARHSLATLLGRLRRSLPVWPLAASAREIGWDLSGGVDLDVERFRGWTAPGQEPARLEEAVSLRRGPFLEDFRLPGAEAYEAWLARERRAWDDRVLGALDRLVDVDRAASAWPRLIAHARAALAVDPLQERFHRWIMVGHEAAGDRAAALAQYVTCRRLLREELDAEPDPATTALRDAIAGGGPGRRRPAPPPARPPQRESLRSQTLPLIGREAERSRLRVEPGRFVLLQGEMGSGKTRLVEDVLAAEPLAWRTVLAGRCHRVCPDLPYAPLVEALDALLPDLDVEALALAPVWRQEVGRLLPGLWPAATTTAAPTGGFAPLPAPHAPAQAAADPGGEGWRLMLGLCHLLAALPGPVLMVVEDLQWAHGDTLRLLAHLTREGLRRGIGVLLTARTGELPEASRAVLSELQRAGRLDAQELGPLPLPAVRRLARHLAPWVDEVLVRRLYDETRGNALFAVEVLRLLGERGRRDPLRGDPADLPIPRSIEAAVRDRVAGLAEPAPQLLAAVAAFAGPVAFDRLLRVSGLPEEAAVHAIEVLLRAAILREAGEPASPADPAAADEGPCFAFTHEIVRRIVRQGTSSARRRMLDRRARQAG